jgi:hypothetical protein
MNAMNWFNKLGTKSQIKIIHDFAEAYNYDDIRTYDSLEELLNTNGFSPAEIFELGQNNPDVTQNGTIYVIDDCFLDITLFETYKAFIEFVLERYSTELEMFIESKEWV